MDDEQLLRIEQKLDWLIAWTVRLEPLVKMAEGFAGKTTGKLIGKFAGSKAGHQS